MTEHPDTSQFPGTGPSQFRDEAFLASFFQDKLLGRIMTRLIAMEVGAKIPSERILSEELGISRTALRDRMSRLASMGIVSKRAREKSVYSGVNHDSLGDFFLLGILSSNFDVFTLIQMRMSIETRAVIQLIQSPEPPDLTRAEHALAGILSSDGPELEHEDQCFHLELLRAAGLEGLVFFWHGLSQIFKNTHNNIDYAQDLEKFRHKHRDILEAVQARDLTAAIHAVDEHFTWLVELLQRKGYEAVTPTSSA